MNPMLRLVALSALLLAPDRAHGAGTEVVGPATQRIALIEAPSIRGDAYAVTGSAAYEAVEGFGYLELWSEFPDGSRYFSRTLDESGPMAKLRGTSAARPFTLPFFLTPESPRPVRLEVNVVLPAGGRVVVSDVRLGAIEGAAAAPGAWWSPETAGWIGGAAGSAVGVLGALIGTFCSLGRARRFVIGGLYALVAFGGVLLVAGLVALAADQPYAVWYPLLLMGALDPILAFSLLPTARRRFEALELRRIRALDARP